MSDPLVEEIVRQVLDALRASDAAPRSHKQVATAAAGHASIRDKVITENGLENALAGSSANGLKRITVAADAILTPSARDWLRSKEIAWDRRPVTKTPAGDALRLAVVLYSTGPLEQAVEEAVSKAGHWKTSGTDCPEKAVKAVVEGLAGKGIMGAVVFTSWPAAVACAMNRRREARAAGVETAACVQRVSRELQANVFCCNPEGRSYFELRGVLRAIAATEATEKPPKWIS